MGNIFAPPTPPPPPPPPQYTVPFTVYGHRPPAYRAPDHRAPTYRAPDYRAPDHRAPDHRAPRAPALTEPDRAPEPIWTPIVTDPRDPETRWTPWVTGPRAPAPRDPEPRAPVLRAPVHRALATRPLATRASERPNPQPRGQCRFFAAGHCRKGANCRFSHENNAAADTNIDPNNNYTYELGGAWVNFNNGGTVSKVVFASDFSAIIIRNIPHTSSTVSVKTMLGHVGISTLGIDIRLVTQARKDMLNAIVKAEDPLFAKTACMKLATYTTLPDMKVTAVPPTMPQSQSPYQIDCRKVHCAWNRPAREAMLFFETKGPAYKLQREFRVGNYKVLGSKVMAYVQQSPSGWAVKLTGLSITASEQDILKPLAPLEKPQKIELGKPDYVADPEFDATIIQSMLTEYGLLERWEVASNPKAKRFNAYGVFLDEASARDAATSLNNKPLSFSKTTRLLVSVVATAKFKILAKIYNMVRPQIDAQKPQWDRQYIRVSDYPCNDQYHLLKLEGDNHQWVAQAKESIEIIVQGEIVRMEGKDFRCGNFRKGGEESKKVEVIEHTFKVLIIPDLRRSQFRVFGRAPVSKIILHSITEMLERCIPESHVIELNDTDFIWASNGGFSFLRSQLGDGIAFYDITSRYKRILIKGSKTDYNNAMAILAAKKAITRGTGSSSAIECPTCFCEPDEPIRMSCGHVYCGDCFVQMCVAETTADRQFQICCPKADSNGKICKKAFSISEIQEHLPSETFEDILKKSFASYVTRHPKDFGNCPTPDCDQIYRTTPQDSEHASIFTCKKCLKSTCTICQSSHPGKPCTKVNLANTFSDKMKERLGVKSCPKCSQLIQKIEGCNHMTCKCGAHVCWVCLVAFEAPGYCYEHMRIIHGGIGI